jgi:hypothetical protein
MGRDALIWQDDVNSFVLEVYDYLQRHPLVLEDENEGYGNFQEFINERFDKFWPSLYTADYRNYN